MTKEEFLNSLIKIAKSDLSASKLLYDNGFYLQSTFYLQQGIEKANKAFGVFGEYLEAKDTKKLGHDHVEIHKKAINHQLNQVKIFEDKNVQIQSLMETISKQANFNYANYKTVLETSRHIKEEMKEFDILTVSEDELIEVILEMYIIDDEMNFEIDTTKSTVDELKLKSKDWILSLFNNLKDKYPALDITDVETLFNKPETLDMMANAMIEVLKFQKKLLPPFTKLYLLGFITSSLVTIRYPDFNTGLNPAAILTKEHPLVLQQPKLHQLASIAADELALLMTKA